MHATLQALETELTASLAGLDARQTQSTPRALPEKWSIQQIAEHLILTYTSSAKVFSTRLERGSPTRAVPSLLQRLGQFYIARLGLFPGGRKAPESVSPATSVSFQTGETLTQSIHTHLLRFDALADQAELTFGHRPAISHAVLGPMPVESWRTFHLMHGRHHIRQIQAIRKQNGL